MVCEQQKTDKPITVDAYPVTEKVDTVDVYFGTNVPDPYRWLEDDKSDKTGAWVTTQNDLTFSNLDNVDFRETVKKSLTELEDYEKVSAPFKEGDYYYTFQK